MPKLLIVKVFVFLLFSKDIYEGRRHVHILSKKKRIRSVAKFWIEPDIELVHPGNFNKKELNEIMQLIDKNLGIINKQIDNFLGGKKVKLIIIK